MLKYHVMIAIGLTLFVTFAYRFALALSAPGVGMKEAYLAGGMVLAGFVIRNGVVAWRRERRQKNQSD